MELAQLALGLFPRRLVVLALGQLEHHRGVIEALVQRLQPGQLAVQIGQPPGHLLSLLLVLPERRVGRAIAQGIGFLAHRVRVEDGLHAGESRLERGDLTRPVDCHACSLREPH
jgi:hypothetical protein